jgi:hypothetical protein
MTRIDGFAFQRQDAKNALMNTTKRFATDKTLQSLDAQRVLAQGE